MGLFGPKKYYLGRKAFLYANNGKSGTVYDVELAFHGKIVYEIFS
jgi:hypothetical protein